MADQLLNARALIFSILQILSIVIREQFMYLLKIKRKLLFILLLQHHKITLCVFAVQTTIEGKCVN